MRLCSFQAVFWPFRFVSDTDFLVYESDSKEKKIVWNPSRIWDGIAAPSMKGEASEPGRGGTQPHVRPHPISIPSSANTQVSSMASVANERRVLQSMEARMAEINAKEADLLNVLTMAACYTYSSGEMAPTDPEFKAMIAQGETAGRVRRRRRSRRAPRSSSGSCVTWRSSSRRKQHLNGSGPSRGREGPTPNTSVQNGSIDSLSFFLFFFFLTPTCTPTPTLKDSIEICFIFFLYFRYLYKFLEFK
jgi:hypothetical protein